MSQDSYFKNKPVVEDYKPATILVFRNGDEYDPGTKVTVARNRFPHWLHLLDYLTTKLQPIEGPVHHLYDLYENELLHFKELENDGVYIAANKKFKQVRYNSKRHFGTGNTKKPFDSTAGLPLSKDYPKSIHSKESYEIYLKNRKFKPSTVRDMWNDDPGKRTKFASTGNEILHGTDFDDKNYGRAARKFPYHLNGSTKMRNGHHQETKIHLEHGHIRARSNSEPRSKLAHVGTVPKNHYNSFGAAHGHHQQNAVPFLHSTHPKTVANLSPRQVPVKIYKERNHQSDSRYDLNGHKFVKRNHQIGSSYDLNGHKIIEHTHHIGVQTRHSQSALGHLSQVGVQGHPMRSSLSDSNIKHNGLHYETATEPYLEVYKYYGKSSNVDQGTDSVEWKSDPGINERRVATQTVVSKERATNTTASHLHHQHGHKHLPALKNGGRNEHATSPKTATVTIPRWAQQLQSAVNNLSNRVDNLINI